MTTGGPSPIATGLKGRCPECGEGSLFSGYLKFAKRCEACGLDLEIEDAGDGPAVFVIFLAGFIVVPLAVAFMLGFNAPVWLTLIIWSPILLVFCIALLRPLRGLTLALQLHYKAQEAKLDDDPKE